MPDITKMVHKPIDPKTIANPLDRIVPINQLVRQGMKVSVYGRPKTGKTRLLCTFPKPILVIATEDGTASVGSIADVDFAMITRSDDVEKLVNHACDGGLSKQSRKPYATIGLDNATQLQSMILAEMLGIDVPVQHARGAVQAIDNQAYSMATKTCLNHLLKFKGNVVYTAHEKNHTEDGTQSDLIMPTIGSGISKAVAGWLNGVCDYVCQTFIREQKDKVEVSEGIYTEVGNGKGEYCLRIGAHPVYMTGFRVAPGCILPDAIVNPTYQKMMDVINGKPVK